MDDGDPACRPDLPGSGQPIEIAAVVLAAGGSRRLGQPKQLLQIEGESLLHRSARFALEAGCSPVFVVLGCEAARMAQELADLPVQVLVNEDWADGMGSSLRFGVHAALRLRPKVDALLAMVCDQPRLSAAHLRRLQAAHGESGGQPITASEYRGKAGVPALFARAIFAEMLALAGDEGAREILRRDLGRVRCVSWPEGAVDVDRPEDLAELNRH